MTGWLVWVQVACADPGTPTFREPCSVYTADGAEQVLEKRQPAARFEEGLSHRSGFLQRLRFAGDLHLDVLVYCVEDGGRGERWDLDPVQPGPEARAAALATLRRVRWRPGSIVGALLDSGQDLSVDRADLAVGDHRCAIALWGGALSIDCP